MTTPCHPHVLTQPDGLVRWDVPILMYHDIRRSGEPDSPLAVSLDAFRLQLKSIAAWGFQTITFAQLHAAMRGEMTLPRNPILLTFDDGYVSFHRHVTPLCAELGMTATVYLCADLFEREWFPGVNIMSVSQAREVIAAGMEVGAHGWHHQRLMEISSAERRREVVDSRYRLEELLGVELSAYAYAYGKYDQTLFPLMQEAGYGSATSIVSPHRTVTEQPFAMRRIQVHNHDLGMRLRLKLSPMYLPYLGFRQSRDPRLQSLRVSSTNTSSKVAC